MKKDMILSYSAPEVSVFVVAAECGYATSSFLPTFGSEEDQLYY